ncbi:protein kinase [Aspergillus ibericus CBS 121593]|uniref:Protein kinase n=1 Tax=Aspergillus ibericus CBS 121593 TaxID=1448316 RepID=A0A395GWR0_9EURO|nr:protein kinase [Aspergillus ibericus CBS 121593]RAK99862.1 protein kinase [Aspergillus ibericus CBS 121593]
MDIRRQFPDVHWVWKGGISFVYEVHPRIVVKVPKSGDFEREQFRKELKIYEIFSQHPPCPSIVQCFLYSDNGIFLEYMRDVTLCSRIQNNHTRDQQTAVVTKVEKLEPLSLRKEWMNDLAQAVAFLESLNLAHGDLRPENILLDRNRLKLSDFDCTAEIGSDFEACMAPYGRILNSDEQDQGRRGSSGLLGPRTEQFALGSLYYLINYGFEVYGDRHLTEDPKEHGRKVVELLQNMEFPKLDGDPLIDEIIIKCWHNKYPTIAELAAYTETLLPGKHNWRDTEAEEISTPQWRRVIGRVIRGLWKAFKSSWVFVLCLTREATKPEKTNGGEPDCYSGGIRQHDSAEDFSPKKTFCQNLEKRGLLNMLSLGEPEQLGFSIEWYRHSTS